MQNTKQPLEISVDMLSRLLYSLHHLFGKADAHGPQGKLHIANDPATDWSVTLVDAHGTPNTFAGPLSVSITLGPEVELNAMIRTLERALVARNGPARQARPVPGFGPHDGVSMFKPEGE